MGTFAPGLILTSAAASALSASCESGPDPVVTPRRSDQPIAAPDRPESRAEAARFLIQATFGPTESTIDELLSLGTYEAWIDAQMALPPSLTLPYVQANSSGSLNTTRHHAWWNNVMEGRDQLRQRVAFALSEIFVVSDHDYELNLAQYGVSSYYDMLATDGFGSFRTLLERITVHPVMGIYLNMLRNERANPELSIRPDENFAREVLQLFTIGLYELTPGGAVILEDGTPVPTYDQATVEEFAKVFTGWNLADAEVWESNDLTSYDKQQPMVPNERYHDTSEKRLLNGVVLPAGQDARTDLGAALDNIVAHANVGPFIGRQLIMRLVRSNPSSDYIGRVAATFNDDGSGQRGNLSAVIRAVLLDPEARLVSQDAPGTIGKIKEPLLRLSQVWRALGAVKGPDSADTYRPYGSSSEALDGVLGQAVLQAHSVFNFFTPQFPLHPGSDLVAPELQIMAEINVASTNNLFFDQIYYDNTREDPRYGAARVDIEREVALAGNVDDLLEHLDIMFLGGQMPSALRANIADYLWANYPETTDESRYRRACDALYAVIGSVNHMVQL